MELALPTRGRLETLNMATARMVAQTTHAQGIDAVTAEQLRDCDQHIIMIDQQIVDLRDEIKELRERRSGLAKQIHALIRGEQALPFDADDQDYDGDDA